MKITGVMQSNTFKVDGRTVINQDPRVISPADMRSLKQLYFPAFIRFWSALEGVTGHRWKATSLIRDSISHSIGQAIDLAPEIAARDENKYGVYRNSDPVLYKREPLIRALQSLMPIEFVPSKQFSLGVYIEPDHLHIQAIHRIETGLSKNKLVKWGIEKPIYPDTSTRARLPMIGPKGLSISGR